MTPSMKMLSGNLSMTRSAPPPNPLSRSRSLPRSAARRTPLRAFVRGSLDRPSGSGLANVPKFARAEDARVAGGDLLNEARARARQADDEDRQVGWIAPAVDRGKEGRGEIGNRPVDLARQIPHGIEMVAHRRARRAVDAVRQLVRGECLVVAVGVIERLGDSEPGRCPALLDRQIGPSGESSDTGRFRIVRRQQLAGGEIAIGVGQIGIDGERSAKGFNSLVETAQGARKQRPNRSIAAPRRLGSALARRRYRVIAESMSPEERKLAARPR